MSWAYPNFFACKKAMEDVHKNYGLAKSKANKLKEWVCEEFEEVRKYNEFTEALLDFDPEELNDWLNSLNEIVEI